MSKEMIHKTLVYVITGLPLVGAGIANLLPISALAHQFLILIVLLWFQFFILFEAFSNGK